MHASAVLALRGRGERDLGDAGDLRGHDVHDDAGGVDGLAAGHVDTDAPHGTPVLLHAGAGAELGHRRRRHLGGGGEPHAADRLLERGADHRVEGVEGLVEVRRRHADVMPGHAVEALGLVAQGVLTTVADIGDDRDGGGVRLLARGRGARDGGQKFGRRERVTTQIDRSEHHSRLPSRQPVKERVDEDRSESRTLDAGRQVPEMPHGFVEQVRDVFVEQRVVDVTAVAIAGEAPASTRWPPPAYTAQHEWTVPVVACARVGTVSTNLRVIVSDAGYSMTRQPTTPKSSSSACSAQAKPVPEGGVA